MLKRKDGFDGERALVLPSPIIHEMERDPLSAMLHITDIGYYPNAKNHFRERKDPISQHVFVYCVEGQGWFRLKDTTYPVGKNQCFVLPAHIPHSYGADEQNPWTIYWIHFKGNSADQYASHLMSPKEINPTPGSRIYGRLDLFEEIYHTLEMGYSRENLLYASSALHYFLGTVCYLQQYRNAPNATPEEDLLSTAIHYMKENIVKKLTLSEIAEYTGYSVSHFSSVFRERTGYSPINYFNQLKIQQACHLLDFTDMKINQICYRIGIDDCYYFSRLFTKIMGVPPKKYKKQKKG